MRIAPEQSSATRLSARRGPLPLVAAAGTIGSMTLLSACGVANSDNSEGDENAGSTSDNLQVVLQQEPPTLEACEANLTSTGVVVRSTITEPLIERNPTSGELEPKLATEWSSEDDTTWTLNLRDDVTFHDGSDFTAEDAAHTIDRAVNSDLGCNVEGYVFGDDDLELNVVDDTTLEVTAPEADPILPLKLSFLEIVPAETSAEEKVRTPTGTGPYQIDDWQTGQRIDVSAFEDYWGEAPAYPSATYQWRGEASVRAAMVTSGEAQIATGLSPQSNIGELGVSYPNNETVALRMDQNADPLNDQRVRQAVNYAIDQEAIVEQLYGGRDTPAAQLVPEGIVGYNANLDVWPYDLDEASALVAEAEADGVDTSAQINLIVRSAQFPRIEELAQVLQEQFSEIGLNVNLEVLETSQHLTYQTRPFPEENQATMMMIQHGNQAGDAEFTVEQYMMAEGAQSYFGNEELDQMIAEASEKSGDERQAGYEEVFAYQNDELTQFAHISHQTGMLGIADSVNYEPNSASGDELRLTEVTPAE